MRKIGIYGGSFNPVHLGHLLLAETCREAVCLDEIWWIPAATSPFKEGCDAADSSARIEMLRLATAGNPAFRIEPIEVERGGLSYTVDTLQALHEAHADCRWYLLMGADSLAGFPKWHEPAKILELAKLVFVARPGADKLDTTILEPIASRSQINDIERLQVEMPQVDISSTELRQRVASGKSIRYRTPRAVEQYIREHGLYQAAK